MIPTKVQPAGLWLLNKCETHWQATEFSDDEIPGIIYIMALA